ncbi:MAG: hypothetical protein DMF86_06270 [Acidobacteria bacterium]|nr:MAG: hypothetical protein DMF86_06270 [Acidobacteriota bacterium]
MRVRFRGVRGSVPWAVPDGIGHGCNTPCIEVVDDRTGAILVLDAGSGIVGLSPLLTGEPRPVSVLLTHYHWDHLQGLPFFATLYQPGWETTIFSPVLTSHERGWLDTMFKSPFFPVPYEHLPNRPQLQMVRAGELNIGGFEVTALPLNHPGGALAYRVRGAAAVVLDAHFTPKELPQHRGWGHSDWRQCAEFAAANNVGGLWLFHHKPGRSDQELVKIRTDARRIFDATETASEGERLQL